MSAVTPAIVVAVSLAAAVAACGGAAAPPPPSVATPGIGATPPRSPDDLAVATVNGHPVWASCVAAQAAAIATPELDRRRAALDRCIAFELLAQAADARGLAGAAEVVEVRRTAAVNRLVETEFEQRYRTPADLPQALELVVKRNEWRMHIVQLRASTFARFAVTNDAPPAIDAAAHALADQLAAELAGETGLFPSHLTDAARRIAATGAIKLETADVKPTHQDDLVTPYATALYAIPAVGQVSPAIRTQWGWDVVLWTGGVEPRERTRDDLAAEAFPEVRRRQFQLWVTQLVKRLGVHITIDQAAVAALDRSDAPDPGAAPRRPEVR
jgi:HPt (histidine-containing phosphotransfer) domain-containing protein